MKHCMMNNTGDNMSNMSNMSNMNNMNDASKAARQDNMEINEQGVDNGAMWEAEPVVVLPPNTPPSIQPQRISDIDALQSESGGMRSAACADGTSRAVPPRAAASVARRNMSNNMMSDMPVASAVSAVPSQTLNVSTSPRATDPSYLQGYLQKHLGKYVQIYFVVGTQQNAQRDGILNEIGTNFLVIREVGSNRLIVCDLYSVKFVNIYDLCEEDLRML